MNNEYFWKLIDQLVVRPGRNRPIDQEELSILHDQIANLFGDWESSNFIKICPHIKEPSIKNVAKAVRDLRDNHWLYERCLNNIEDRIGSQGQWGPSSYTVKRYALYPMAQTPDMRSFLKDHALWLTPDQKARLTFLKETPRQSINSYSL